MGAAKRPFYRIVAADSRRSRNGRFLELLGTYNPVPKPAVVSIAEDKMTKWLDQGAVPSDTVGSLLAQVGFTEKYLRGKKGEDITQLVLRDAITERPKKTRRMKKATVAATEPAEEPKKDN